MADVALPYSDAVAPHPAFFSFLLIGVILEQHQKGDGGVQKRADSRQDVKSWDGRSDNSRPWSLAKLAAAKQKLLMPERDSRGGSYASIAAVIYMPRFVRCWACVTRALAAVGFYSHKERRKRAALRLAEGVEDTVSSAQDSTGGDGELMYM